MKRKGGAAAQDDGIRKRVRERYGAIANGTGCGCTAMGAGECCSEGAGSTALQIGYSKGDLANLPAEANLGLGCGNPTALASLRPTEVVLDLGSGAGIDCFLAARRVGAKGRVIGVDMTPEMVTRARANARKGHYANVEFRLGEIEHVPAADASVDVVISNCVINLVPDKAPVYREAFRVLRPGGRLAVSDVVATRPITAKARADPDIWTSCSLGALEVRDVKKLLRRAGFKRIRVDLRIPEVTPASLRGQTSWGVVPAEISATKPAPR